MERPPDRQPSARLPGLIVLAAGAAAVLCAALAAAAGPPYLGFERLSAWVVGFAVALFSALFAVPFAIHRSLGGRLEADARWERALLRWGAIALGVLAAGLLCGLPSGFAGDSLAGSLGAVAAVEGALVLLTLLAWLLSG